MAKKRLALDKDYQYYDIQTETIMKGLQQFSTRSKFKNPTNCVSYCQLLSLHQPWHRL